MTYFKFFCRFCIPSWTLTSGKNFMVIHPVVYWTVLHPLWGLDCDIWLECDMESHMTVWLMSECFMRQCGFNLMILIPMIQCALVFRHFVSILSRTDSKRQQCGRPLDRTALNFKFLVRNAPPGAWNLPSFMLSSCPKQTLARKWLFYVLKGPRWWWDILFTFTFSEIRL